MGYLAIKYAKNNEIPIYKNKTGYSKVNKLLMNTWMGVVDESQHRYKVVTAGRDGWVTKSNCMDHPLLKVFFIDVGQGDGVLIEVGDKRILIDGGPNSNLHDYLTGWQYSYAMNESEPVHIDYVFISHFDADHYRGLTSIINDPRFSFGTVFHNGIARFHRDSDRRPAGFNTDLGIREEESNGEKFLITSFNDFNDVQNLLSQGGLQFTFSGFLQALKEAKNSGRLNSIQRIDHDSPAIDESVHGLDFKIEFLGPVSSSKNGETAFKWFDDSSHTRNGHSIVMKLIFGEGSILLGGDLNSHSEKHLMEYYKETDTPFRVDVAKSCHHGSSDFDVDFMKKLRPFATVISSGDNESYAHPRADAVGSAGRYSRGKRPKVFSTELARSINSGGEILFGMINLRSDGKRIYMAQMLEVSRGSDVWDSYKIK